MVLSCSHSGTPLYLMITILRSVTPGSVRARDEAAADASGFLEDVVRPPGICLLTTESRSILSDWGGESTLWHISAFQQTTLFNFMTFRPFLRTIQPPESTPLSVILADILEDQCSSLLSYHYPERAVAEQTFALVD